MMKTSKRQQLISMKNLVKRSHRKNKDKLRSQQSNLHLRKRKKKNLRLTLTMRPTGTTCS
jgi:hypothetical protein